MSKIEYYHRERNIPQELHEAWNKMFQRGDIMKLKKITGKSLPVLYAAIKNGYVKNPALANKITQYFNTRPSKIIEVGEKEKQLIRKAKKS